MSELALRLIEENKKTKAKSLDLGNCGLTEVPEEVGELVWLEELILSNKWTQFNFKTKNWYVLESQNNGKRNYIASIKGLEKLLKLVVLVVGRHSNDSGRKWELSDLSPISNLKNLQYLDCLSTQIIDLSPISSLLNLQLLIVQNTQVSNLLPISPLVRLQMLGCFATNVIDLSPISSLHMLQYIDFGYTEVNDLSPIESLLKLEHIDLHRTNISDLKPINWHNFENLLRLDLSMSKVENLLPVRPLIEKGLSVKWDFIGNGICVQECPLTNPPVEIVKQGNEAILNYFREKEQQGTVKGCEAKMLLVGEGGSGKTSLMRRLYQTDKLLPEENESTKGIDIHRHDFKMADGTGFRLNVWDFGGQEIYHATHQFFLTKRSLYVLLDDTRKDHKNVHDEGFKYWLEAVDMFGGHSPVLIFQNEKSDRSKQIDIGGIKGKFDNVQGVWQGNLEHPGTADKLREAIEHFAKNLSHVGEELPAKWVSIRSKLEEMSKDKPYISQQEYFKVYGEYLEFDRTKALHLSQYLHDLGVFLHFQDDALLTRIVILQNNWATEAVFKMLDDETVKGKLGRFT